VLAKQALYYSSHSSSLTETLFSAILLPSHRECCLGLNCHLDPLPQLFILNTILREENFKQHRIVKLKGTNSLKSHYQKKALINVFQVVLYKYVHTHTYSIVTHFHRLGA
jgi:hypothetical protein